MLREGKSEARNPGNNMKSKVKFKILFFSCLDQPSVKLQIMIVFPVLIPGQNFLFPGTGREITKCHGKGREIWGLYSRESRETGIPAHPCCTDCTDCSKANWSYWNDLDLYVGRDGMDWYLWRTYYYSTAVSGANKGPRTICRRCSDSAQNTTAIEYKINF